MVNYGPRELPWLGYESQPLERQLIEQILAKYGLKPEALPNLFGLRTYGPSRAPEPLNPRQITGATSSAQDVVEDLANWRRIFPETIDSINGVWQEPFLPTTGSTRYVTRRMMRPTLVDIVDIGDVTDPESLGARVLANEPQPPQFSPNRFYAKLPDERFSGVYGIPRDLYGAELTDEYLKPNKQALRMLDAMERSSKAPLRAAPRWGDRIAASALVRRLEYEHPEAYDRLIAQIAPLADKASGTIRPEKEQLIARIGSIYSQFPMRYSSEFEDPTLMLNPIKGEVKKELTVGRSIFDRMKEAEFKPTNKKPIENVLDELERMQVEKGQGFEDPRYLERYIARGVPTARNPTNQEIQKILGESIGFGEGKMAGTVATDLLTHVGPSILAWLAAEKLASSIPNKHTKSLAKGALTGAGIGSTLGSFIPGIGTVAGGAAGAGIGALAAQVF